MYAYHEVSYVILHEYAWRLFQFFLLLLLFRLLFYGIYSHETPNNRTAYNVNITITHHILECNTHFHVYGANQLNLIARCLKVRLEKGPKRFYIFIHRTFFSFFFHFISKVHNKKILFYFSAKIFLLFDLFLVFFFKFPSSVRLPFLV